MDVIIFIYRDEYYNKNSPDKGLARSSSASSVWPDRLGEAALPASTRFDNLAHDSVPAAVAPGGRHGGERGAALEQGCQHRVSDPGHQPRVRAASSSPAPSGTAASATTSTRSYARIASRDSAMLRTAPGESKKRICSGNGSSPSRG